MAHYRRWLLALLVLLAGIAGAAVIWALDGHLTAEAVETYVLALGVWAPIGFIVLYGLATVAMVPGSIFDLAGGALWGPYFGSLINLAGGSLVARYVARDWVQLRAGPRTKGIMQSVDADGWKFVAFVRIVPIFPYNVVNYLLGLTHIPFHQYMLATLVFMSPATVVYTYIGHASRQAIAGNTDNLRYALLALGLLAVLLVLPRIYSKIRGV